MTHDAADALARLDREISESAATLARDEALRPALAEKAEDAERANRAAELALAKATADHAGVEAEWRIAEAAIEQAETRLARLKAERERLIRQQSELAGGEDPEVAVTAAREELQTAGIELSNLRKKLEQDQERKSGLQSQRDDAASKLATARAELAGIEREYAALARDRDAQAKRKQGRQGLPIALDHIRVESGYERALAAVLGRDSKSPLGAPSPDVDGRFWTGSTSPSPVADSLLSHISECPDELKARLALVHYADRDDARPLSPGEWLVTKNGHLRRWDGFLARGEGSAEAARLEATNRLTELESRLPAMRSAAAAADESLERVSDELTRLQRDLIAQERLIAAASERERQALRMVDKAEAAKERLAGQLQELAAKRDELTEQFETAELELKSAQDARTALPAPDAGRAALEASQAKHETARLSVQATLAELAAHDQALAVTRERHAAQTSDQASWQARSGEAAQRVAEAARRLDEIEEERAVVAAKPASLIAEIEQGDALRERLGQELAVAEQAVAECRSAGSLADNALSDAGEALAVAREGRATLAARAESQEARRGEMARVSGERFQCPPPLLLERFEFGEDEVRDSSSESEEMDRMIASRERIGPVNLVAADELAKIEEEHGHNASEQAELTEAVNRLRGSIGNLNREGRERLRAAFEEVDGHFQTLFTRLFQGGQAHLALIDSDDPLDAGLEIYAQPPGKRLQSLSLLSGGEQALTATALIFALFLTNPAPICVLDEVDAPLDDANVERFCDLLDSMVRTTKTRYLIVTHNAVTMSRMHRLFGVTMAEKGVSRLVSVDLGEAELMAAE